MMIMIITLIFYCWIILASQNCKPICLVTILAKNVGTLYLYLVKYDPTLYKSSQPPPPLSPHSMLRLVG